MYIKKVKHLSQGVPKSLTNKLKKNKNKKVNTRDKNYNDHKDHECETN